VQKSRHRESVVKGGESRKEGAIEKHTSASCNAASSANTSSSSAAEIRLDRRALTSCSFYLETVSEMITDVKQKKTNLLISDSFPRLIHQFLDLVDVELFVQLFQDFAALL